MFLLFGSIFILSLRRTRLNVYFFFNFLSTYLSYTIKGATVYSFDLWCKVITITDEQDEGRGGGSPPLFVGGAVSWRGMREVPAHLRRRNRDIGCFSPACATHGSENEMRSHCNVQGGTPGRFQDMLADLRGSIR